MGAGEAAFKESTMVVEMLEELLAAGFPKETAIQMLNTALVMGREEVRFSTIDMSVFDLYSGKCEFVKAGACLLYTSGYLRKESMALLTVVSNREMPKLNQLVLEIDPKAFMIINQVNEVMGRGFTLHKHNI